MTTLINPLGSSFGAGCHSKTTGTGERYDIFADVSTTGGSLSSSPSPGSDLASATVQTSPAWIRTRAKKQVIGRVGEERSAGK